MQTPFSFLPLLPLYAFTVLFLLIDFAPYLGVGILLVFLSWHFWKKGKRPLAIIFLVTLFLATVLGAYRAYIPIPGFASIRQYQYTKNLTGYGFRLGKPIASFSIQIPLSILLLPVPMDSNWDDINIYKLSENVADYFSNPPDAFLSEMRDIQLTTTVATRAHWNRTPPNASDLGAIQNFLVRNNLSNKSDQDKAERYLMSLIRMEDNFYMFADEKLFIISPSAQRFAEVARHD